ncbi:MAG: hypothetical protein HKM06_01710 [Spirochaetales bacterium]|nr:hypothetical protein [Spirochaetales bacterium]
MDSPQLADLLDHDNLVQVEESISSLLRFWYPEPVLDSVSGVFHHVVRLFQGHVAGYQACNTDYHNLKHTVDVVVATVRLLDGRNLAGDPLDAALARDLVQAALLHDVGYIQKNEDTEGTGAKYTKTHVGRGVLYADAYQSELHIAPERVPVVGRLIWGTDLAVSWESIGFAEPQEEQAAAYLATGDLLGQMADRTYLEKLLFLYYEFREAGFSDYQSEFDMLKKTMGFYQVIQNRLDTVLHASYNLAAVHFKFRFGVNENLYLSSIERQKNYLQSILDDTSSNFRKKLKRLDLEGAQPRLLA